MTLSPETPLYVLFAAAGKHAMDHAIYFRRAARRSDDRYRTVAYTELAETWRVAAWDHLAAARDALRRSAA